VTSWPSASWGELGTVGQRADGVLVAMDHQDGAPHPRGQLRDPFGIRERFAVGAGSEPGRDQRLRVGLQPPAHGVLDRLGGVRLTEHLREEELQELPIVLAPVVLVELGPPVGRVEPLGERVREPGRALPQRQRRGDEDDPRHPLGMERAELQRPGGAQRHRDQHRPLGAGGIHDGQGVGGELGRAVCLGLGRPVGAAVAAPVEGEHAAMSCKVRDLHLPVPRVHDRPGWQEEDRRLARPVDLVVELGPVALDVAVTRWLACPHRGSLLARAVGSARRRVAVPSGSAAPPGRSRAAAGPPRRPPEALNRLTPARRSERAQGLVHNAVGWLDASRH
jgi:hypothetical protein